jgi:hypothetical protein
MTSTIKVDTIQDQDGNNIINENSNTITIGASGDTIVIPSGATITNNGSQSGFGRTGTVDWQTTVKTSGFAASAGEGYFVNTTSGAITATLPGSPTALDIIAFKDYGLTFDTNNLTIDPGSNKIEGSTTDMLVSTEGRSLTLVYLDSTQGWKIVNDGNSSAGSQSLYVTATGGTVTTSGNFKIHTFTGPGTFCVSCAGNAQGSNTVSYMVIGGGAGAGANAGGGGGAGGYREGKSSFDCYTASPLNAPAGLPVSVQGYPIAVGGGGAGSSSGTEKGASGVNSTFSTITSAGGGGGGTSSSPHQAGVAGGSGGGARANSSSSGGAGNTPPVSPPQGNAGGSTGPGSGPKFVGGGGGGAGGTGCSGMPGPGAGGLGTTSSINATPTTRASGGGGGSNACSTSGGGTTPGGGGTGANNPATGTAGTANTGGGGGGSGGAASPNNGQNGGSGIVIIRYKFQ